LLGVIVGAYHRAWKLRREELVLLQVLASQTSAVLENMQLMTDVVEARNEARKLLRQVLDDQRLKDRLDRLASLGEMAASVAHEVRNPLASIKTSMQILRDDLSGDEPNAEDAQESVAVVLKEVERLDSIVRDLLLFARPRQLHCVPCNLVELSDQVLHVMQAQCTQMGIIVHRVYHDVPLVYVDMGQIEQVLFNLYMNAIQAMPDSGVLTVSCQVVPSSPRAGSHIPHDKRRQVAFGKPIGVCSEMLRSAQQWLELSVSDTGVGIAPDQLERIFQPFFTTKAHGIGLGLPITRRLVEDHRGYLLIESQLGYGTTVSVRLPIVEQEQGM
jgi:signal transduction histidine kinase